MTKESLNKNLKTKQKPKHNHDFWKPYKKT